MSYQKIKAVITTETGETEFSEWMTISRFRMFLCDGDEYPPTHR
jgi:hypothetical protein